MSARQSSKSARAAMGNIMQIWSKTWNFKNQNSSSDSQLTPTFISWLEKAWVGNMISCVIWPSINSWRHHNGLRTQIFNLHIMTSAYFCKIDCISVNIDQFSFKFWYVLPGNILYKCSYHDISFWQWHHGVFLRLKEACQFFTFCVYSLWDMTFSQNWFYILSFASNISVVLALFTLSFEYVVAETISYHKCALYFSIRCRDHAHISITKWDLCIPFSVYV